MSAEMNRLISMGGTQNKSPIQRYMDTRAQVGAERRNKLAMESTAQSMGVQREQLQMQQQKQQAAMGQAYAKAITPVMTEINKLGTQEEKQAAYTERMKFFKDTAYQYGIPPDKMSPYWEQSKADSFMAQYGKEQAAPTTRNVRDKAEIVNQEWNSKTGVWKEVGRGIPRARKSASGLWSKIDPSKYTPESLNKFATTTKYSDLVSKPKSLRDGLTVGESAVDRAFAKEYVAWSTGGFADVEKNLEQLKGAHTRLSSGKENLTGAIIGRTPDIIRQGTHPESIDVRDQVEEVVQRNLRLILGAQFTQKEGERLIARAYNQNLDEAVNAKRVGRLIVAIETAAKAKQDTVDYYNQNGTLKGYKGKQFKISDFDKALDEPKEENNNGWSIKKVNQ